MVISLFSFFAGVGMLDLAFERSGYNVVLVNEYDDHFLSAYKYVRKQLKSTKPIYGYFGKSALYFSKRRGKAKLSHLMEKERELGHIVGFIGGPPCPDFSVAGKNNGSTGKNGRLTKTYFDIICRTKPDFFVFENVKGLVNTAKHRSFYNEMQTKLIHNGYVLSNRLLNALSFGVPQFREREIMIGINKNAFPIFGKGDQIDHFEFPWEENVVADLEDILSQQWPTTQRFIINSRRKNKLPNYELFTVEYWFRNNDVYHHKNSRDRFKVLNGAEKINTIAEGDTSRKSFKRLHRWRYSPTACYGNNEVHLHPYKARRLSVSEAMAIQSLPKEFELPSTISLSAKFKTIGNGVPYLLAKGIAETLYSYLKTLFKESDRGDQIQDSY